MVAEDNGGQALLLQAIVRIETEQKLQTKAISKLESAILGSPEAGIDGLVTRVKVLEARDPIVTSHREAVVGGAGGGVVAGGILAWLIPLIKDLLTGGGGTP